MTSLSLQYANQYWEDRLRKESLAASMHEGAPHHDQCEMHRFLAADREGTRGNWTMHRTKSRASLAWQEYAHGKNPITGYDTRYRHDADLPFFPPRSPEARRPATSTATDAFPSEPRMRCARGGASNHICCAERAPQARPTGVSRLCGRGALEAARSIALRREMDVRPQTASPHETGTHSPAQGKAQASSATPAGLAQFDRDLAARRKEGLRGEPAPSRDCIQPPTSALHPCVHPCPPAQHTHVHCARALHQHFHRPPFAIMASDADWPPLPSERRSSAVYQPMVRLPTFRCVTPTYNRSAPAPAPLTNSYIQHNILHQAPAARAVTTGGARGLPCRPEGGGRARPAGKACLLNRALL